LQVIDILTRKIEFDSELKGKLSNISSSNIDRLLYDLDILDLIGLRIENGRIVSNLPQNEIRKLLKENHCRLV